MPFEVALLETGEQPVYQRIAEKVENLLILGLSKNKIAQHLEVDDKTVIKAIRWRRYHR